MGRPLVGGLAVDGDAVNFGLELAPQPAPRPTACGAYLLYRRVEFAHDLQRIRQRKDHALQTARVMCGMACRAVSPTKVPRARESRWGVRSPLRYGRNRRSSAPDGIFSAASTSSS